MPNGPLSSQTSHSQLQETMLSAMSDILLFAADIYTYMFYSESSNYINSDGFYIKPVFSVTPLLEDSSIPDNLSSGEVGIIRESFEEEVYGVTVKLYSTVSDADNPAIDYDSTTLTQTYTYDSAEELALQERFGSAYTAEEIIEATTKAIATEVVTTAVNAQHTFKKVRYLTLNYDNLSSFEDEEATQNVSVSTSYVTGAMNGSSY
tara:strand:+ start:605 stop:1222 length:618 start_codon:yes stop_codon:yes gene_type:complete